jgi:hypothetical protein
MNAPTTGKISSIGGWRRGVVTRHTSTGIRVKREKLGSRERLRTLDNKRYSVAATDFASGASKKLCEMCLLEYLENPINQPI